MKNDVIERKEILENVLKWKDEDLVKVITGVRRSGKSTVLRMIESSLKVSGVSNDCIAYIDFECREYQALATKEQVWEELDRPLRPQVSAFSPYGLCVLFPPGCQDRGLQTTGRKPPPMQRFGPL